MLFDHPQLQDCQQKSHMPAALLAVTPVTASSRTRQPAGSAAGENSRAARRKISGAGFPLTT